MKLKEIRIGSGYTQKEIADILHCSTVVYSRYETGARQPSIDVIIRLADFFDVTTDELLGVNGKVNSQNNSYETELLNAARKADTRAVLDAITLLKEHAENK